MLNLLDVVFFSPPPPLHHQPQPTPATAVGLGVSIFPLLPCLPTTSTATTDNAAFSRKDAFSIGCQGEANQSIGGRGPMLKVCRDSGNRAKKECVHRRRRTCCRNHVYDCPTHLKNTWVPASKRRERQHQHDNYSQSQSQGQAFVASSSTSFPSGISKRQRVDNAAVAAAGSPASNTATPCSFDTISCPQDANFKRSLPGKVQAPAVFRCIRVTAISDNAARSSIRPRSPSADTYSRASSTIRAARTRSAASRNRSSMRERGRERTIHPLLRIKRCWLHGV